jgi:transposase
MEGKKKAAARSVGIDLSKRTYQAAFVGADGRVTMSNGKTHAAGRQALYKKLRAGDKVSLEAGNMAFIIAKEIEKAVEGSRVYVLNPSHLALIYGSMKKTDKEDSLKLAHILEDCKEERLPVVPVPSDQEMRRRKLLSGYQRAQQSRNRKINQLHALFVSQGITTKVRSDLSDSESRAEAIKELSGIELGEAEYLAAGLELCEKRIAALEKQMAEEAAGDEEIERLQSIPGVGPKVSFAFAAHVAAERFENAGQVGNYLGLVPRVYISGDTVKHGRITKRGNGYVRALLVQAAWALIRAKKGGKLRERYEYMTGVRSISKKKAIVAIARRLAEEMYTLMRDGTRHEARPFTPGKGKAEAGEIAQLALSA